MTASGTVGYRMQGKNVLLLPKDKEERVRGSERGSVWILVYYIVSLQAYFIFCIFSFNSFNIHILSTLKIDGLWCLMNKLQYDIRMLSNSLSGGKCDF